jgi:hypothetical protein
MKVQNHAQRPAFWPAGITRKKLMEWVMFAAGAFGAGIGVLAALPIQHAPSITAR